MRTAWIGAVFAGAVTAMAVLAPFSADAAPSVVSYNAVAAADGMRVTTVRPDAPLSSQVTDGAVPGAQAQLSNLDGSTAYASYAYPGETALSGPGLLSGIVGASLPRYPVIAASDASNTPSSEQSVGPLLMRATSSETRSTGTAVYDGGAAVGTVGRIRAQADTSLDPATATLKASATDEVTGVDVAGVLSIAAVRAQATAEKTGAGKPVIKSHIEMGDMTVAGVRVALTDKGLVLPGQTSPLPDTSPLTSVLRDAGVTVEMVGPTQLAGGVRSAGVQITVDTETPDGGSANVVYLLGAARASVTSTVEEPVPDVAVPQPPTTADSAGPPSLGSDGTSGGAAGPPPIEPEAAPPAGNGPTGPAPAVAGDLVPASFGPAPFSQLGGIEFYLVLVLAAGTAVAAQHLLRRFGVASS